MDLKSQMLNIKNLENITLEDSSKTGEAKAIFCKSWPVAKKVLEAIAAMVKNSAVKAIILVIVNIGDGIAEKHCNEKG